MFFPTPHFRRAASLLMPRRAALPPPRTDGRNIALEPLFLRRVRSRRQLDQRVERDFHPRALLLRHVHIVRIYTPQHRLMRDDDDILAPLEFHNNRLESDHHVAVRLPPAVAVVVFVVVARAEVFGVAVFDFLVGEPVADAAVEFVQGFPFEFGVAFGWGGEEARRLDRAFECAGPDREVAVVADGLGD